ncbi:MAG: tyrosine-type recombinase/integrase [Armatimonadota bacterium]
MKLTAAGMSYILECQSRNLSRDTISLYKIILRDFARDVSGQVEEVTTTDIRSFLSDLTARTSKATARRYYTALRTFFAFCMADAIITADPMTGIRAPKCVNPIITPLSSEEIIKLMEANNAKTFLGIRNRLILLMLIDCGLRASELCDLNLEDVDTVQQVFTVRHGKGDKSRIVPFGAVTAQALRRYIVKRGDQDAVALIVNCYGQRTRRENLLTIVQKAGMKAGLSIYPHLLRHSMAVSYLRNGGDVFTLQRILGHSDLNMTKRYCELANTDVVDKHRLHSPADRLGINTEVKRKRIK